MKQEMKQFIFAVGLGFCSLAATAQVDVEHGFGPGDQKPIPVSLSGFTGEAAEVIKFDLYVQGFCFTNDAAAQFLINGSNNGNLAGRVSDRFNKATVLNKSY